jgi:DNA repair protein RadA/Sms
MSEMNLEVGIKGHKQHTNINDINIPAKLRERKKTGLSWFDDALGCESEGFVPSSVMMLTGGPGAGKTTALLQMGDSITAQGHICLFNTGEQSLFQVAMTKERLNLKYGFIAGQDIMVKNLLNHADNMVKQNPKKQLFILQDSLPTLNDGKYADGGTTGSTPIRCAEMLTNYAKKNYAIVIFINHVNKNGDFVGKNTVKHAVDQHAMLYIDDKKNSETFGERLFTIPKNRFGSSGKTIIVGMGKTGLYEKGSIEI